MLAQRLAADSTMALKMIRMLLSSIQKNNIPGLIFQVKDQIPSTRVEIR
jgi:hypothetical protein